MLLPDVGVITHHVGKLGTYALVARSLTPQTPITSSGERDGSSQGFQVEAVEFKADQFENASGCPTTVKFTGYIKANGPGTVKYTFTRSDGATGPVFTLDFDAAGVKTATTTWTLGGAGLKTYKGWQAIKIISPNQTESSHESGAFVVECK